MRNWAISTMAALFALAAAQPALSAPPPPPPPSDTSTVVVTGQKPVTHKCGERDQACIKAVIQRIWTENPKEVQEWCVKEGMRYTNQRATMRALLGDGAIGPYNSDMSDTERQLCDYGRTHKTP